MYKKFSKVILITLILILVSGTLIFAKEYKEITPQKFNQSPILEKKVEEGELPPVKDRLPVKEDVYVVKPKDKIGEYGGTIKVATTSPTSAGDGHIISSYLGMVLPNPELNELYPEIAKNVESNTDKTVWTIQLREGLKWSDGHPFTVEDILFWYNDILLNEELTPAPGQAWKANGEVMEAEKIDDYTIKFKFKKSKPFFINDLVHQPAWAFMAPKHYLKNFHPQYISEEKLASKTEAQGFDNWWELFQDKNNASWEHPLNPELPTLGSMVLTEKKSNRLIYERNPYYWKVDTEGNQLPYIEKQVIEIVNDKEVIQGKIMSGENDFCAYYTDIRNYPMYKKYEKEGGFRTILWNSGLGSDVVYMFNLTHEDPALREVFQNDKFRKAMSLAINRPALNDTIYFGRAEPRQYTVLESSKYFEPEFAESYVEYNPEKAKELLDEIGLKDRDGDGIREYPGEESKNFNFTVEYYVNETPKGPITEMVVKDWGNIGIDVNSKQISGELQSQRAPANMLDATLWHGGKASDVLFPATPQFFVPISPGWERTIWPKWGRWFQTDGESGEEPPEKVKELRNWWEQILVETDTERRIELGKKILASQAENLWCIGTIGKTSHIVTVDDDLINVPEDGTWAWDAVHGMNMNPEQMAFENGVNEE